LWKAFAIWDGGLGIPGGIAAGVIVGLMVARRRHLFLPGLLDSVAPVLPLAQAIGRWGNWFNQELFGRPSGLP
jgi:prolipoprotein diacylglyceryltransferase